MSGKRLLDFKLLVRIAPNCLMLVTHSAVFTFDNNCEELGVKDFTDFELYCLSPSFRSSESFVLCHVEELAQAITMDYASIYRAEDESNFEGY